MHLSYVAQPGMDPSRIQSFMLSLHDRPIVERTLKTVKSQARSQAGALLEELAVEVNPLPIQTPNPTKCGKYFAAGENEASKSLESGTCPA